MEGTAVRSTLSGMSRAEKISVLRSRMSAVESVQVEDLIDGIDAGLPLALPRRAAVQVNDCPALVVELISRLTVQGLSVGIVGWPELSVAAVEHLDRIVLVPDPGPDPVGITSVLVEGLDMVVHHSRMAVTLTPTQARPLQARLRKGHAALLMVGMSVPSPALRIEAKVNAFRGLGRGSGRIRGLDIDVTMAYKSGRQHTVITVGEGPAVDAPAVAHHRPRLRAV